MAVLLQVLAGIISVFFTGYSVFFAVVFCGYFRRKKKFPEAAPKTRFAVLIAARNEEKVIGDLVDSLLKQRYPRELYDVVVIPNNCRDHTAQRARKHGAKVLECTVPVKSKGEVLQFAFSRLMKEKKYDAFCVFDADNVVDPGYLEAMNRAFCSGARIAQGYRESKNPGSSWVSGSYSIYFRMIAECVNRPRAAWGLPVFLGGTGWAVSSSCLDERGWETASIVEDCEYSLKCVLWGEEVAWVHDAITYDEQPVSFRQSFTQRRRWSSGYAAATSPFCTSNAARRTCRKDYFSSGCTSFCERSPDPGGFVCSFSPAWRRLPFGRRESRGDCASLLCPDSFSYEYSGDNLSGRFSGVHWNGLPKGIV